MTPLEVIEHLEGHWTGSGRGSCLANDARILETERVMLTTTTPEPVRHRHLKAWLRRSKP